MTRRKQSDDNKNGAVPRAEKEPEKRGVMWILGSSIVGIIAFGGPNHISPELFWA
jgi:hypothetical protein